MKNFNDIYSEIQQTSLHIKTLYKKNLILKSIVSIIIIFIIILMICLLHIAFYTYIVFILGIILLFSFFYKFHLPSYRIAYKRDIISKMIASYDSSFTYHSYSPITKDIYYEGEFDQEFNEFHAEDGIEGMIDNLYPFLMSEVETIKISTYTDSRGKTCRSKTTLFDGFFIKLSTDISLPFRIYIRKRYPFSNTFSSLSKNMSGRNINYSRMDKISMDDSEFEKLYYVETNNQMLTMQLLTISVLRQILDFKKIYQLTPEFTFKENSIYIRFYIKGNIFEPPMFKSPLNYNRLKKEYKFISSFMDICNDMIQAIHNLSF